MSNPNTYFLVRPTLFTNPLLENDFRTIENCLKQIGISFSILEDQRNSEACIFPSQWMSFLPSGKMILYPLEAANDRTYKNESIINSLVEKFKIPEVQDWTEFEPEGRFLEGTQSLVIDYAHGIIYAALSPKTSIVLLEKWAAANQYRAMAFVANDTNDKIIPYTNQVLFVGESVALLCEEAIPEEWELIALRQLLESSHKTIITVSLAQAQQGITQLVEIQRNHQSHFLISETAFSSLTEKQKEHLNSFGVLLPVAIPAIESIYQKGLASVLVPCFTHLTN